MSNRKKPPVGRGSPPTEHQFGANKPGNRRGRPKGSKNIRTIVRNIAQEKHSIKEGEETIELTTVELLFRMLAIKAMNGDIRADKFVDRFLDRQSPTDSPRRLAAVVICLHLRCRQRKSGSNGHSSSIPSKNRHCSNTKSNDPRTAG